MVCRPGFHPFPPAGRSRTLSAMTAGAARLTCVWACEGRIDAEPVDILLQEVLYCDRGGPILDCKHDRASMAHAPVLTAVGLAPSLSSSRGEEVAAELPDCC